MRFKFEGELEGLETGIQILCTELGFKMAEDGIPVKVENNCGKIEIIMHDKKALIRYDKKIHFFRALGLLIEALHQQDSFIISEQPAFTTNGVLIDASRNAVMKTESIKKMLRKMAIMGLNLIMIYTEDTYTIEDEPYFGYMRGRYTFQELKECDDYADAFGIEMIPCIQTLAHLEQFLKWDVYAYLRDSQDIMLAGDDRTYQFIEKMIRSASAPFRSKRVNICMDEAINLGLGRYLAIHGYQERFGIMINHLKRVLEITTKYNIRPMMWSDMFFVLGSNAEKCAATGYDLDAVIPQEVVDTIPKDIQLVYWAYAHPDEETYRKSFRKHKEMGFLPVFAGTVKIHNSFSVNYVRAFSVSNAALSACKKEGVKEVFTTLWMDDGAENNFFAALLGLQLYAEHGYAEIPDAKKLERRVKTCTGIDYDAFMDLKYLDETPGCVNNNFNAANPSRFLLWQDILMGLFDRHVEGLDMAGHYTWLGNKMRQHKSKNRELDFIFEVPDKLCSVLSIKSDIGLKIKEAYDRKDMPALENICIRQLPELYVRVGDLRAAHRELWLKIYKPFGWEVLDIRYGGVLARVDTTIKRLKDYLEGKIEKIEELEEEKLYFDSMEHPANVGVGNIFPYSRMATANVYAL